VLNVYANGEINYALKGVNAKVVVTWEFEAPVGGGDTHYSIMKGSKANLIIRQGKEQNFIPELYIEANEKSDEYSNTLDKCFAELEKKYPGITLEKIDAGWHVNIPESYRIGHEAHFGQVTENFLQYMSEGKLPKWEVPNMITKYYTTTSAYKIAHE
ncbi:MAG: oxidoreductase, partial [Prevotellaceae bacterium]|nr:oxidoreductase [Candidatus Faecinaster equi]